MRRRTWSESDFEATGTKRLQGGEGGFGGPTHHHGGEGGEGTTGSPRNAPRLGGEGGEGPMSPRSHFGGEGGEGFDSIYAGGEGGGEGITSDARLKDDIVSIGSTSHGLPLYRFRYKGADEIYAGVMAQDVLEVLPEAVSVDPDGFYRVNYGMLGIKMERLN